MSTSAVISVKQEDGTYRSISVMNDGYTQNPGVGYMLSTFYLSPTYASKLIEMGNVDSLDPQPNENGCGIQLGVKTTVKELLDYCVEKQIDYLYVYEDDSWQWAKVNPDECSLIELTMYETIDHIDRDSIDKPKYCSYATAAKWLGTNLVLLNNIQEIDKDFDPYVDVEFPDEEDEDEDFGMPEFFQYYITDLSDDSVDWMRSTFPDLIFSFSELLNSWILCVQHYGTSWDYVSTEYIGHVNIDKKEYDRFNKD
jgi:hypothetical protein